MAKLRYISAALFIVTGGLVAAGVWTSWHQHQTNTIAKKQVQHAAANRAPSAVKPKEDEFASYTAAADQPRYLFIPDISVRAIVKPLGLTQDQRVAAPSNIFYTGWYTGSSKPGSPGAMLIDGHVSSWEAQGVFYRLKELRKGQIITVQRGDNTQLSYKISKIQTYNNDDVDMAAALAPINPNKPGLNLMTCAGSVKKGTNEFSKRLVVFAEQQ
ncbi:MAG TPA: class F sortase [Candidatus Saccharimonadales bacterium]|nr:class F sortase [Candidatus Saccharimonadales bacterium]